MTIQKVGVLGCGLMGSGIAEVCAKAGIPTVVREVSEEFLAKGMGRLEKSLGRAVDKGKLSAEDRDGALGRLSGTTDEADLADCDLIIEAIVEDVELKCRTYGELDKVVKKAIAALGGGRSAFTQLYDIFLVDGALAHRQADRFQSHRKVLGRG